MNPERRTFLKTLAGGVAAAAAVTVLGRGGLLIRAAHAATAATPPGGGFSVQYSDAEWRRRLTPEQYRVLRQKGTEAPFSSPLTDEHRNGTFQCAGCRLPLFSSATKYDSGTGWPSFWAPLKQAIATQTDHELFIPRTEVHCRRCGGHLGHVFDDGPQPTGQRYCMNGVALSFQPA